MPRYQQPTTAYDKAITLLGIRMHTSFELERKLRQKGFEEAEVSAAIERLKTERYLNDDDTALSYLNSLINHKTFGYYGIKAKMQQKGISSSLIERLLEENFSLAIEEELAKKYLSKNKKSGDKAAMGLKQKGFRNEVIAKLVKSER